jgi:predicted ester cyclase
MKKLSALLILAIGIASVFSQAASKEKSPSHAEKNKALIRQMYDYFNANDWEKLATIIAPDFVTHTLHSGQKQGFDGMKEGFAQFKATFPDVHNEPIDIVADGDLVIVRGRVAGTQKGEMNSIPPSGKTMDIDYFDEWVVKNGKVTELWGISDVPKLMEQLGLTNSPTGKKE